MFHAAGGGRGSYPDGHDVLRLALVRGLDRGKHLLHGRVFLHGAHGIVALRPRGSPGWDKKSAAESREEMQSTRLGGSAVTGRRHLAEAWLATCSMLGMAPSLGKAKAAKSRKQGCLDLSLKSKAAKSSKQGSLDLSLKSRFGFGGT